jgi:hypothetical protein
MIYKFVGIRYQALLLAKVLSQWGFSTGELAFADRPHAGVPEIGQSANANSPRYHGSALPVASS